jgi:DNA-binding MarR family transcriptional regulator
MFDHCMYFNTTALSRLLEREWAAAFKPFGLTPPQAFMLRAVLSQPGLLQRELADTLTIARPTATRLLDGLSAKGLVERRASDKDGREQTLFPTAAATAMKAALNEASGAVTRRLKARLGAGQFSATVDRLREVRRELG